MFYWFQKFFLIGFWDTIERSILEISIVLCTPIFIEKILMKEWAEKKVKGRRGPLAVGGLRLEARTMNEGGRAKDEG